MADLATQGDLAARLGRPLTSSESTRAAALLADASALVRGYTRQTFDLVTADEVVLRPVGTVLRLPQRPVVDVTAVVALGCADVAEITLTAWCWDGSDKVDIDGARALDPAVADVWQRCCGPNTYKVTNDHGYAATPADVVAVVTAMVLRTLTAPTMVAGLTGTREQIGQYSTGYQFGQFAGGLSPGASVTITDADKAVLDSAGYRRRSTTVQTSAR